MTDTSTKKTSAAHKLINFFILAAIACTWIAAAWVIKTGTFSDPKTIPFEAAEEARIVCTNFTGLRSFTSEHMGEGQAAGKEKLTSYRITAKCLSGHTITGIINISAAAPRGL